VVSILAFVGIAFVLLGTAEVNIPKIDIGINITAIVAPNIAKGQSLLVTADIAVIIIAIAVILVCYAANREPFGLR